MKILFLARYLPQAGSTTHIYTLARELIKKGHEVHLLSSGPKNEDAAITIFNQILEEGIIHHKIDFPQNLKFGLKGKVVQLIKYIAATPRAIIEIYKIKPDVIHVHYPVTSYIAKLYKLFTGKKFATTYHTTGIPKHPLHKKADYVIAISQALQKELIEKFHYKENQIRLIYNGVSREMFDRQVGEEEKCIIKKELYIPQNIPIIGFVGSLNSIKGLDVLLEACGLINGNFHLVLLGDGDQEWVTSLIEDKNLTKKVSIYPFQNPYRFYSIVDIFVLPSRKEGFGLASVEAMMMGIPTIRSNVGGSSDQIDHGLNGYIFKNEDAKELAKYLYILLEDKALRKNMGDNARNLVLNKFTEDIMMDKLINLYEHIEKQ